MSRRPPVVAPGEVGSPSISTKAPGTEPFFFGPAERRLYGCLHSAASPARGAVLVCPPIGHEAIQFHRALRELAGLLAAAGFSALRFDYFGCGDSAADETSWSLESWPRDLVLALEELRRRSGSSRFAAVGLRLGGSLVAMHGALHGNLEAMVLWDPVVDGSAFLEEQRRAHENMLQTAHVIPVAGTGPAREILGFALPAELERQLAGLDLEAWLERPPADRVCLIESNPAASQRALGERLQRLGCSVRRETVANPHLWTWIEDFARVHVPQRILRTIVGWLAEESG